MNIWILFSRSIFVPVIAVDAIRPVLNAFGFVIMRISACSRSCWFSSNFVGPIIYFENRQLLTTLCFSTDAISSFPVTQLIELRSDHLKIKVWAFRSPSIYGWIRSEVAFRSNALFMVASSGWATITSPSSILYDMWKCNTLYNARSTTTWIHRLETIRYSGLYHTWSWTQGWFRNGWEVW